MTIGMMDDPGGALLSRVPDASLGEWIPLDFRGPTGQTYRPFPASWLDRPIIDVFAEAAAAYPDKTAIDDGDSSFTYREVHQRALTLAHRIARVVERDAAVGICLPNGANYPVAMLAALAAGRAFVPLDPSFPAARNALILEQSGMQAIIVDGATGAIAARMNPRVPQIDFAQSSIEGPAVALDPSADDVALVMYTSGSTGQPKGAHHTQRNVLHNTLQRTNSAHLSADDRIVLLFTPTVAVAQQEIFGALLNGATLFVVDLRRKGFRTLVEVMRNRRITLYTSIPAVFRQMARTLDDPSMFPDLRMVLLAADRAFAADVELFRARFAPGCFLSVGYGSTEGRHFCQWFIPRDWKLSDALIPVGYVRPDFEVTLVGENGAPVPRGEVGEIVIRSRYIVLGYWHDDAATRAAFAVPPDDPMARIFHTGDLGRLRPDGLLELIGRKDRQLKILGQRVEPGEIEAVIRRHPAVLDAAVVASPAGDTLAVTAYVVADKTKAVTVGVLGVWLAQRLGEAMRPREIVLVDAIPMLGNFKHDYQALETAGRRRAAEREPNRAASGLWRRLARMLRGFGQRERGDRG
jgi:fengycin family lipopeptide synthetase E